MQNRNCGILIVEDEPLVAMDLAETLERAGFDVIGPAHSVVGALALLKSESCVAAVLDVCLDGETSEPVARRLAADGVPFVTLTGYSRSQLSLAFQKGPTLSKPAQTSALLAALHQQMGRAAAR